MKNLLPVLAFLLTFCYCFAVERFDFDQFQDVNQFGSPVNTMEQQKPVNDEDRLFRDMKTYWLKLKKLHSKKYRTGSLNLVGFSWSDCGDKRDPMHISKLSISPNPLKIPGNVTVSVQSVLKVPITAPLAVELSIYKKVLIWVKIPCIDNLGSCTYGDGCAMIPFVHNPCPPPFVAQKIPCKCPVNRGSYNVSNLTLAVNPQGIPSWLEDGSYKVTATLTKGDTQFGCIHAEFSLTN